MALAPLVTLACWPRRAAPARSTPSPASSSATVRAPGQRRRCHVLLLLPCKLRSQPRPVPAGLPALHQVGACRCWRSRHTHSNSVPRCHTTAALPPSPTRRRPRQVPGLLLPLRAALLLAGLLAVHGLPRQPLAPQPRRLQGAAPAGCGGPAALPACCPCGGGVLSGGHRWEAGEAAAARRRPACCRAPGGVDAAVAARSGLLVTLPRARRSPPLPRQIYMYELQTQDAYEKE